MPMQLTEHHLATELVPGGCDYAVLAPETGADVAPLLFVLHGGGGDRRFLATMQPIIEAAIADGLLPPVVAVTPSAAMSYYMDFHDDSEQWETLLMGPLAQAVVSDTTRMLVTGVSMGGVGALRLSFRNPDRFVACASLEAGVDPFLSLADVPDWYQVLGDARLGPKFGTPTDPEFWAAHNPANIAASNPDRLKHLKIYLEVGTHDSLYNHHNVEFLHRVLFDNGIAHEYRTELGADHVGRTIPGRFRDGLRFLGRAMQPETNDAAAEALKKGTSERFRQLGVEPPPF